MFNSINIGIDGVEFEYIEGGRLYCVNVGRPDSVSYSQWSAMWESAKEVFDSGKELWTLIDERVDVSELQNLEDTIDELRDELDAKNSEIAGLENEITKLELEIEDIHRQRDYDA